jgi:hypothetical protein
VRVVFLLIWALITAVFNKPPVVLWSGLTVYTSLSLWTVIQRLIHVRTLMLYSSGPE